MRINWKIFKLATIVSCLFISAGCCEVIESQFDSVNNARKSIKKGWIPEWIPKSAFEIKEAHNIDTNAIIISFKLNKKDWQIPNQCSLIKPHLLPKPTIKRYWWPSNLLSQFSTYNYVFFRCGEGYLAMLIGNQQFYYWEL